MHAITTARLATHSPSGYQDLNHSKHDGSGVGTRWLCGDGASMMMDDHNLGKIAYICELARLGAK